MDKRMNNVKKSINTKYHKYMPTTREISNYTKVKYSFAKFKYEFTDQLKAIILVVLVLILVLLFYFLIYKQDPNLRYKTFIKRYVDGYLQPYDFNKSFSIKHKTKVYDYIPHRMLQLSVSNTSFVFSFWTIINEWQSDWVHLLSFTDPNKCPNGSSTPDKKSISNDCKQFPGFWLSPKTNRLNVCLDTTGPTRELVTIDNIPLRRWFNIVCVIDNYAVGIYIDGKLTKSYVIDAQPLVMAETGNVYINQTGQSFAPNVIQLAYLQVFSKYLNPKKIYELYETTLPDITKYQTYLYDKLNIKDISPFVETGLNSDDQPDAEYIEGNDVFNYDPLAD